MALVVLLRGVNVGGNRTFRPAALAGQLGHLGAVNIGAAGTFIIRKPIGRSQLRAELTRRLPFETRIMICEGREIQKLIAGDPFAENPPRPDLTRFVSVLSRVPRAAPDTPFSLPTTGKWLVKILGRDRCMVVGVYRRHMKTIGYLGKLDRIFGEAVTTRNWNTITAIADALRPPPRDP